MIDISESKTPIGNLTLPRVLRTPSDSMSIPKIFGAAALRVAWTLALPVLVVHSVK